DARTRAQTRDTTSGRSGIARSGYRARARTTKGGLSFPPSRAPATGLAPERREPERCFQSRYFENVTTSEQSPVIGAVVMVFLLLVTVAPQPVALAIL